MWFAVPIRAPVVAWHESVVHALLSLQVLAVPAHAQLPPQVSPVEHALPSSHGAPLSNET
jgi:hypothetical protein